MTYPSTFRTTVHGTVFAGRSTHLEELSAGDRLILIPDPPGADDPAVWVHLPSGDPVGHLPPEINAWLAPLMLGGGSASATAVRVGGSDMPSWKRLLIEVNCSGRLAPPPDDPPDPPSDTPHPEGDDIVDTHGFQREEGLAVFRADQ